MAHLAGILRLEHKNEEANTIFNQIDAAVAKWDPQRRQAFELISPRILSLYASGQVDAGIAAAEQLVKRQSSASAKIISTPRPLMERLPSG